MEFEHKTVQLEIKEIDSDGHIAGYASVYNNVDLGGDIVMPDAFAGSLEKMQRGVAKPKMLWQHNPSEPIGVWEGGRSDEKGLFMKGRILKSVGRGADAIALTRAGAIDGLSIGYKTLDFEYREAGEARVREIKAAELWETSLVTFPMNTEATLTDVKQLSSPRDVERVLREAGVPGGFAKLVALHGFEEAAKRLDPDWRDAEAEKAAQLEQYEKLLLSLKELKEAFHA